MKQLTLVARARTTAAVGVTLITKPRSSGKIIQYADMNQKQYNNISEEKQIQEKHISLWFLDC